MIRVCFVCLGNICRSPTAHGIMDHIVAQRGLDASIEVDSAGTSRYHIGEKADGRSRETAKRRGFELTSLARQFVVGDFDRFEYVLAMDSQNEEDILSLARSEADRAKVYLCRSFDPSAPEGAGVPDPYYGGPRGFEDVFDICQRACEGLLEHITREHDLA